MVQINLLPTDLAPRPSVIRVSGIVKRILVVGFIIFILAGAIAAALYLFYSRELSDSKAKVSELKTNIKALEVTETRLILVRDRLEKAGLILGAESSMDEVESAAKLVTNFPQGVILSDAKFQKETSDLTLNSPNTTVLRELFKVLTGSSLYKNIDMTSFSFSPQGGFDIKIQLIK